MAAETPDPPHYPSVDLTVTGGDGDAERTGYWTVTGPQDPHEAYAVIERSMSVPEGHVFFAWYLNRRTQPEFNAPNTHMVTIAHGFNPTYDGAMEELGDAWVQMLGTT